MTGIRVVSTQWEHDRALLREIREQVFILEQGVPKDLEWDNLDASAEHFIAYDGRDAVGCARLIDHKKIGRMAVLASHRQRGVGREILDHIKRHAAQKRYTRLELSAQCHAYHFYRQCGFNATSTPYEDADIPHVDMDCLVFSQDTNANPKYQAGHDTTIYHGTSLLEAKGYLDLSLSQANRSLVLCIKDISHPLCQYESLINRIKLLARTKRHFKTYILLGSYHPTYNDHPLFKLADRLPSYVEIRTTQDPIPCQWLIDSQMWFDFDGVESRACYSDRPKIQNFMERFNKWWQTAKQPLDARRLSI